MVRYMIGADNFPMSSLTAKPVFEYTGGNLSLDFANTCDHRAGERFEERLTDYGRLVQWGVGSGAISQKSADRLLRQAGEAPGNAQSMLRHAIQLREAVYDIFSAVAARRGIPSSALAVLNAAVRRGAEHASLEHANRRFVWKWIEPEGSLDSMLWPAARAAAELLASDEVGLVRQCASETCNWLFVDKTKNHRRRWCDMKTCGNRDKARRYYQRQKTQ